ncbi:DUF1289 domain-containing protein [Alteromonas lipotrueiana]|uniref:DUF1289 domain-containing protein n=1 Tax=Alteromonas lipotrueiana TaxID=2803815 RepID=UPI001C465E85
MGNNNSPPQRVSSCIGCCKLASNNRCEGCKRSISQIKAWPTLTHLQRMQIINACNSRTKETHERSL